MACSNTIFFKEWVRWSCSGAQMVYGVGSCSSSVLMWFSNSALRSQKHFLSISSIHQSKHFSDKQFQEATNKLFTSEQNVFIFRSVTYNRSMTANKAWWTKWTVNNTERMNELMAISLYLFALFRPLGPMMWCAHGFMYGNEHWMEGYSSTCSFGGITFCLWLTCTVVC